MKLSRLELVGFKSFMNKTVLNFENGVTCVVGPNGCGKSNVVDAIFWVMGDQSAKHLRGSEMEDVIFAGSDQQSGAGMAEINLTLSTEGGGIPAEYSQFSEITVSRKLYRSGESEYLINRTPCRLKDIVELFMDTGLGAKSYSIIEQGHIEKIVGQKPEERRFFIEEAAGISKFKSRKREAQLKMDGTSQNLLRLDDIISEIKRQMSSLERQAKKAERYKHIKEQIREIDLTMMSQEFTEASTQLGEIEKGLKEQKCKSENFFVEIQKTESSLEQLKLRIAELEKMVQSSQQEVYQIQQSMQGMENQKAIKKKEIENWKSLAGKDQADIDSLQEKGKQSQKSCANVLKGITEIEQQAQDVKTGLEEKEKELESEFQERRTLFEQIEKSKHEWVKVLTEEAQCQNSLINIEKRLGEIEAQWGQVSEEDQQLQQQQKETENRKKAIAASIYKEEIDRQNLLEQKEIHQKNLQAAHKDLQEKKDERDRLKDQCQQVETRLHSLLEIQKNFEGYDDGVKALLQKKETGIDVIGVLADFIETDKKYEKALEAVLGHKLQYLLVPDRDLATKALDYLNQSQLGVCHVVPLDTQLTLLGEQLSNTAFEPLWQKIRIQKEYENFLRRLLKDVYVVKDMKTALEIWDKYPDHYTWVTLSGECVTPLGVIYGGRRKADQQGLLSQKRYIKELEQESETFKKALTRAQSQVAEITEKIEQLNQKIQSTQEALHHQALSETSFKKDIVQCDSDLERVEDEMSALMEEKESIAQQRKSYQEERVSQQNRQKIIKDKKNILQKTIDTAQLTYEKIGKEAERKEKELIGQKVIQASLQEKREALQRQKEYIDQTLQSLEKEIEEKKEAVALAQERESALTREIAQDERQLTQLVDDLEKNRKQLSEHQVVFHQELQRSREIEEGLKKQRSEAHRMDSEIHEKELKCSQHHMLLKHLSGQAKERYMIDLEVMADRYQNKIITEEDKKQMETLKEKAAGMGEVNLTALEEFDDLRQRHDSLEKQSQDLVQSMESLKKTIEKINRISRKRFEETFRMVNEGFKKVFPILFGGGKAELYLTDESNLLETGIDIMAKPPGKKHRNISLLSGGEKALTAVSLMFSIFMMKPSPFCLLDEVDAPLDDANIGRFNEMVRSMTNKAQFVIITHNKKTMAMADILYGVTMESPGISTMVSVKLDRAIEISKKNLKSEKISDHQSLASTS